MRRGDDAGAADVAPGGVTTPPELMTVGELADRTGMSRKSLRQLEALGLIYSAGRSSANYRLYDESAIWCVDVVRELRLLGLTLREIQQLATIYLEHQDESIEPHLTRLLDHAQHRIEGQLRELVTIRARIIEYQRRSACLPEGANASADPRRTMPRT